MVGLLECYWGWRSWKIYFISPDRYRSKLPRPTLSFLLKGPSDNGFDRPLWLNSEFIPWNGKIFEFQKNFIAIWFGIQYYPYAEILGRLRAVCPKKSSKTWYRYRRPCIWEKSFKIELFTKNKSCSGFSMKNCWTVKFFVPRFSSTLEYRVF